MKSVMQHSFAQVPEVKTPRSRFNRSHGFKTTLDAGYLVPVFVDEALPGDTFNLRMTTFGRLATPIVPVMDNLIVDSFFFAIPYRLVWNNFQKFMGEQTDPGDSTDFLLPTMAAPASTGYAIHSLSDYFGIPTGIADLEHVSLWHRAYNLVWNEWFRDQNLQDSVVVDKDDGPDDPADYVLLRRGKRHDYFTSCLPWPQKGTAVSLPLGTEAPVRGISDAGVINDQAYFKLNDDGFIYGYGQVVSPGASAENPMEFIGSGNQSNSTRALLWQQPGDNTGQYGGYNIVDLSEATAATINDLRQAFQLQRLYERDARGGTRYTEIIRSHFGVISPDARLQRPEYLGGGRSSIHVHPIAQTSSSDTTTPQGNLAAFATMSQIGHGFTKGFTEHCLVMGLVNIRADLTYQQGLNRMFSRSTRFDLYWPALSHIGEQAVLNKEIYAQGTSADDDVFGYNERYAEYRYKPSLITGKFRSTAADSLDIWHLSQEFGSLPTLNNTFIQDDPPVDRIIATPDEPHLLLDCHFDFMCARPMPVYAVPGLIDHF